MNITQILLSSTAAMLLAALIFSYGTMKGGEAEDGRQYSAKELMRENARIEAELTRYRTGQIIAEEIPKMEMPGGISKSRYREIQDKNKALSVQLAAEKKKRAQAEAETLAMTERQVGKLNKEQRRANMIAQAMLMAQIKEIVMKADQIQLVVLDVKRSQSVRINTELAVRRGTGIIGRLTVSNIDLEGNVFADLLPGTFPGKKIDLKVGDELIFPPQ